MISETFKSAAQLFIYALLAPMTSLALPTPDTRSCCLQRGVSDLCVEIMCDYRQPPNDFQVYSIQSCGEFLPSIAQCLADDRDHTPCCKAEAADADQDACFDLCSGSATALNTSHWDDYRNYISCLSLNIHSIFQCYQEDYQKSPTPPRKLVSEVVSPTSAVLSWKAPIKFNELVKKYHVYYGAISDIDNEPEGGMQRKITIASEITLDGLNPDTKYSSYVVSANDDGEYISQKSESSVFVTQGVPPNVTSYKNSVIGFIGGTKTLVCRVNVRGLEHRHLQVVWQKQTEDASVFLTLQRDENMGKKYGLVAYLTEHRPHIGQPRTYISALRVQDLTARDFGLYRCIARNQFGADSADISLEKMTDLQVPSRPPNITACCQAAGVTSDCIRGCQSFGGRPKNATIFIPNQMCALDTPKILGCSMKGIDQGACCLRRKVPFSCLPFCDGTVEFPLPLHMYSCLLHTTDILTCHLEAKATLPEVPQKLKISKSGTDSATVNWRQARRATIYHVYFRIRNSLKWERKTVSGTNAFLAGLHSNSIYEIVVIAANSAGNSDSSRISHLLTGDLLRDQPNMDLLESAKSSGSLRRIRPGSGKMEEAVAQN